ncbi:uncharacterized protein LOC119095583 [Pollicipes pollicipes]|uniref:uncharacterized protein LOC119095583 n=1 Tax=Pollicipes pollicipes TaxID=41117 RepID=UPI001884E544|nr:uncharacterized protein LOC119095583 [Pollicipes pollicipes]
MRTLGWLLLLAVSMGPRAAGDEAESFSEEQFSRQLIELTSGEGFINRVFNRVSTSLSEFFSPGSTVDRQGVGALLLPIVAVAIAAAVGVAVAVAVANYVTDVIASGRGLTADDWEISHTSWLRAATARPRVLVGLGLMERTPRLRLMEVTP